MKILIINYRYFVSGGPERYMFNLIKLLKSKNHTIIPFSIKNIKNSNSKYERYFVDPIGDYNEIYFKQHKKNLKNLYKLFTRLFYDFNVRKKLKYIIKITKPDAAIILHYLRKLSPSILDELNKNNIPIIVRLSDFALICPQAHFINNNKPCILCKNGKLWNSVIFSCVQNNKIISVINLAAMYFHKIIKIFNKIDLFIVPTKFHYNILKEIGFKKEKIVYIPTFVDHTKFYPNNNKKLSNLLYVGRIERIKGIHILIEAIDIINKNYPKINYHLNIIGEGNKIYLDEITKLIIEKKLQENIKFMGYQNEEKLQKYYSESIVTIIPSIWFENLPNSLIESFSCGTSVLASNLGSIPENIINNFTGMLFEPGNSEDLANKILFCLKNPKKLINMGINSKKYAVKKFSDSHHYNLLLKEILKLNKYKKIKGNYYGMCNYNYI